jgi:hypothetical protein
MDTHHRDLDVKWVDECDAELAPIKMAIRWVSDVPKRNPNRDEVKQNKTMRMNTPMSIRILNLDDEGR